MTFIGTPASLEARLVPEAGVAFHALPARGFDRSKPLSLATSSAVIAASTATARRMMRAERPDAVIGFGGYVSIPVGMAAVTLRVPLVLHEQNSVPGLANRVLSRWARQVGVTYDESRARLKYPDRCVVTGNPIRAEVLSADRAAGRRMLGIAEDALVLLVFGGSRGARHLNSATVAISDDLLALEDLHVVQVTGAGESSAALEALGDAPEVGSRWHVHEYLADMGGALAAADLIVARAGATSIAEITALGRPAVLVPYPYATDDHQTRNAATLLEHGAADVVADGDLDTSRFGDTVLRLLRDPDARATMSAASRSLAHPDAAARVADLVRHAASSAGRA